MKLTFSTLGSSTELEDRRVYHPSHLPTQRAELGPQPSRQPEHLLHPNVQAYPLFQGPVHLHQVERLPIHQYQLQVFLHRQGPERALHQQMRKLPLFFALPLLHAMPRLSYLSFQAHKFQLFAPSADHRCLMQYLTLKNRLK